MNSISEKVHKDILEYINGKLILYRNICKDRNSKSIEKIKSLGFTNENMYKCLNSEFMHDILKNGLMNLYESLFIDIDPYLSVT